MLHVTISNFYLFLSDYKNAIPHKIRKTPTCSSQLKNNLETFYFISSAAVSILRVYGINALSEINCSRLISHFQIRNSSLQDDSRENRRTGLDFEDLETESAVTLNPVTMARELSEKINVIHTTVQRELKRIE